MPARSVIFDSVWRGNGKKAVRLTGRQYTQMSGRAGRLSPEQRDTEGSVFSLIARNQVRRSDIKRYESGTMEPIQSRLDLSYRSLLTLFAIHDEEPDRERYSIDSFWSRTLACAEGKAGDDQRLLNMRARWSLLEKLDYRQGLQLTNKGKICARISNKEVAVTEAWENQWLLRLSPVEIAGVFGCLNCDKRDIVKKGSTRIIARDWWDLLKNRVNELRTMESELGIPKTDLTSEPFDHAEPLFVGWAQGMELESVKGLLRDANKIGDFINWTRMAIQGLTSLIAVLQSQPEDPCIPRLIEARSLLERDEVLWEKIL